MATPDLPGNVRDDRVLALTRWVSLVIIPFLVVAFVVLVPWPTDTGRLFAWQIKPTLTSMVLGSVYLGGAYFFLRAFRAKEWHTVKGGFVPVGTFAALMGVATIAHWDKFLHTHVAFWLWAGLYFTTPFLVFLVFLANRKHDAPATGADRILFERSKTWRGLARIQDFGARARNRPHKVLGERGDAAQALEEVEGDALG